MKTKTIILALLLLVIALRGFAQTSVPLTVSLKNFPHCGFQQMFTNAHVAYPDLIKTYRNINARANAKTTATIETLYDIPVVFHVVCHTTMWDIADSIIANQIDILNRAYRKQHADTLLARSFFRPLSADAHIQFHLATTDPDGNFTSGITRTHTTFTHFGDSLQTLDSLERVKHTVTGGIDSWPSDSYLNVWVCNMTDSHGHIGVLGYGTPPLNPLPPNWPAGAAAGLFPYQDGVVIQVHAVGSNSPLNPNLNGLYTKGRALVHEVGHYLGLQHVFGGNDGAAFNACDINDDDGISDTPEQSSPSFDASSGFACPPAAKNSCVAAAGDLPDMWENYMDYAHDACQVMFTNDQATIMLGVLQNQRSTLPIVITTTTNAPTGLHATAAVSRLRIYPNPAEDKLNVQYTGEIKHVVITNMLGETMMEAEGMAAETKVYDLSRLSAGQYIILIETKNTRAVSKFAVVR